MIILNRYKVKDVTKFKRFLFLCVLIISFIVFVTFSMVNAYSNTQMLCKYIYVEQGDTLWSIAASNNTSQMDVRELVYKIQSVNKLNSNSCIYPGDVIIVPLY